MNVAALVVAVLALVVSILSAVYTRRSAHAADRSAGAAEQSAAAAVAAERRDRTPKLVVTMVGPTNERDNTAMYMVRNDGPQDLDSVVVHRPEPEDRVTYPVATEGEDFSPEPAELGPLALGEERRFVLAVGSTPSLPTFRVRIVCRAGDDCWEWSEQLDSPRSGPSLW